MHVEGPTPGRSHVRREVLLHLRNGMLSQESDDSTVESFGSHCCVANSARHFLHMRVTCISKCKETKGYACDINKVGILACLPYIVRITSSLCSESLSDDFQKIFPTVSRKRNAPTPGDRSFYTSSLKTIDT